MRLLSCLGRRAFVSLAIAIPSLVHAREDVVVLTSYPEEVFSRFEAVFERANPDLNVEFVWRMPHDALPWLRDRNAQTDIYWSPAHRNFIALATEGLLAVLDVDRAQLPGHAGPLQFSDPQGRYEAVEMAGFGIVSAPAALANRGLTIPREWSDLADERFDGLVLVPVPSKVGFAATLVDVVLQSLGWRDGWSLLSRIAAFNRLIDGNGAFISEELRDGKAAAGLTIDFFARSAIAHGAPFAFTRPKANGYSFAHVGLLTRAAHPAAAHRFVAFLLSPEGQGLLGDADVAKLPVRPSSYDSGAFGSSPFDAADALALRYDPATGIARSPVVAALFDAMITRRQTALREALRMLRRAERMHAGRSDTADRVAIDDATRHLEALPLDAERAADAALNRTFDLRRRGDPAAVAKAAEVEREWDTFFDVHSRAAVALLSSVVGAESTPP